MACLKNTSALKMQTKHYWAKTRRVQQIKILDTDCATYEHPKQAHTSKLINEIKTDKDVSRILR